MSEILHLHLAPDTYARAPFPPGGGRLSGFSLIELMVAITISSIILIALVVIFMGNRATYQSDEGIARMQESARFAMEFLTRDIRMAGYAACLTNREDPLIVNYLAGGQDPRNNLANGIWGFEYRGTSPGDSYNMPALYPNVPTAGSTGEWAPALDATLLPANRVIPGTDVLVLSFAGNPGEAPVRVIAPFRDAASFTVSRPNNFSVGQILMVTDCKRASIFQATNVTSVGGGGTNIVHSMAGNVTPGNRCATWGSPQCPQQNEFDDGSEIMAFRTLVYYVGAGAGGRPALFQRHFDTGIPVDLELVEGVESMQVLYGIDTDGDPFRTADRYVTADGVTDWTRVVSARVDLLVATSNVAGAAEQTVDTRTYTLAEASFNPNGSDRLRRWTFSTTVRLRNRER